MYTPKFNQIVDRAILIEAMQAYSFAILIGPEAAPQSEMKANAPLVGTHLPLVVKDEGPHGLLEGTLPVPIAIGRPSPVTGVGYLFRPHSYVSPALYVDPLSVPHGTTSPSTPTAFWNWSRASPARKPAFRFNACP